MILKVPSDLLILRSFDTIGSCAKPLALLYIGGTIALMESGSLKKAWPVVFVVIIKLIVMPVVIFRDDVAWRELSCEKYLDADYCASKYGKYSDYGRELWVNRS